MRCRSRFSNASCLQTDRLTPNDLPCPFLSPSAPLPLPLGLCHCPYCCSCCLQSHWHRACPCPCPCPCYFHYHSPGPGHCSYSCHCPCPCPCISTVTAPALTHDNSTVRATTTAPAPAHAASTATAPACHGPASWHLMPSGSACPRPACPGRGQADPRPAHQTTPIHSHAHVFSRTHPQGTTLCTLRPPPPSPPPLWAAYHHHLPSTCHPNASRTDPGESTPKPPPEVATAPQACRAGVLGTGQCRARTQDLQ